MFLPKQISVFYCSFFTSFLARCSSVVRLFAHGAMGRRIDPSWGGPIELFHFPASSPRMEDDAYKRTLAANQKE